MHTGMLWFDNSKTSLNIKVQKAVQYYVKKYSASPDLILVHPSMLEENSRHIYDVLIPAADYTPELICKLKLRAYRPVLPGHIWIGIEDTE